MLPLSNRVVLFQGDSITDCGRDFARPHHLGTGYPALVASRFAGRHPEKRVTFLNRGISGNTSADLLARWQVDAIDLQPHLVSILIGINDTWRRYDSGVPTPTAAFEANYRAVLEATRRSLQARLVLCEPFLLPVMPGQEGWREDLDPKIEVVRRLAGEYGALLLPLDGLFGQAASHRPASFWLPDGVHPSPAGHVLIADAWLEAVLQVGAGLL